MKKRRLTIMLAGLLMTLLLLVCAACVRDEGNAANVNQTNSTASANQNVVLAPYANANAGGAANANMVSPSNTNAPPAPPSKLPPSATQRRAQMKDAAPFAPPGYKPRVGERVLTMFALSWFSGKVIEIKGDTAVVELDDGSAPLDKKLAEVFPYPSANSPAPAIGDFILLKPAEEGDEWKLAEVVSINGAQIAARKENGETLTVNSGDFAVLKM